MHALCPSSVYNLPLFGWAMCFPLADFVRISTSNSFALRSSQLVVQFNSITFTSSFWKMASRILNSLGRLGLGLAVGASVVNTALYNGKSCEWLSDSHWHFFLPLQSMVDRVLSYSIALLASRITWLVRELIFWSLGFNEPSCMTFALALEMYPLLLAAKVSLLQVKCSG